MTLPDRDRAIVSAVARFGQLSSKHIYELIFSNTTQTPCDRALRRLVDTKYLARIERRMVGGNKGGSGQYVYQLGRRGFFLFYTGRYNPLRSVNYHSLAIADCYMVLRRLELADVLNINAVSTEPDCWVTIGNVEHKPDMYMEVERRGDVLRMWYEVDMATEGQKQILAKLNKYWRAYNEADDREWPEFPLVIFVAVDDERERELTWLVTQAPKNSQALFKVTTRQKLYSLFL